MLSFAIMLLLAAESGRTDASALFQAGNYREAARAYITLLRNEPNDLDLLEGAGRSMLGLAAPERAIPYLERELALAPLHRSAAHWLAEAFIAAGQFNEPHELLARMTTDDPTDVSSWVQLGMLSYKNGYYGAALEAFDHALTAGKEIDAAGTRNRVEILRAISLIETGSIAQAAEVMPSLLARPENSTDLDLLLMDVRLLYETGNYAGAFRQSDRALAVSPENAAVHFWRARLFQEKGELSRAISEAERSRELAPESPAPRGALVRFYLKSGREQDAAREAAWLREHESATERTGP